MSVRYVIVELAARHRLDVDALLEDWEERAAIREYLGGMSRASAELWAIGDVERMHGLGLHEPGVLQRWAAGGDRVRPALRGAA
jgi:hypothetical protein